MKTQTSFSGRVVTGMCFGLFLGAGGCVGSELDEPVPLERGELSQEATTTNGLSTNGLSTNGLSTNGLSTNGLSTNGLSTNGLSASSFSRWFNANESTAYSSMVMKYVVACALPAGQTRTWTNPTTGVGYSWPGMLGLAPAWANGSPATVAEQQVVSACLAAHVNKFGMSVSISVRGRDAAGAAIPVASREDTLFTAQEGCFFGNLFNGAGIFVGHDSLLNRAESTARACGLSAQASGGSTECPPLYHVGSCASACILDETRAFWKKCVVNGVSFVPLTTRLRPQDIYRCGDGTCQFTESCGVGSVYNSCASDCGSCGSSGTGSR
ncbi:hypothetical protein [Corallococcus llansteffanensis]|uniref:Uncharacterized protein n=1 Tax=Corallococcus llansteffanensis TaxID=2316731 RepID=A0A3A8QQJ3_9BACT|nr:hypothetical protein [Corallococcus llansteffanensis]RKH65434.1 hypothetical protein D7V93_05955 [Corallococcus llansteffanensis]